MKQRHPVGSDVTDVSAVDDCRPAVPDLTRPVAHTE
jgi:hypothetical protein